MTVYEQAGAGARPQSPGAQVLLVRSWTQALELLDAGWVPEVALESSALPDAPQLVQAAERWGPSGGVAIEQALQVPDGSLSLCSRTKRGA